MQLRYKIDTKEEKLKQIKELDSESENEPQS